VSSGHPHSLLPRLQILGAALLFSTGGAAIKSAAFTSWQVAGLRSAVAAVALWLILPQSRRVAREARLRTVVVAMAYAATLIAFVVANKLTTAANSIFLQSTAPLYVLLLGPFVLAEPVRRTDILFALAVGSGMAVLLLGDQRRFATAPDPAAGNAWALASGVAYAALILGLRSLGKRGHSSLPASALGNLIAFLATLPMALPIAPHPAKDWLLIGYLGIFQIGAAYALLASAMPHVPAVEASLLLLLEMALNPIWAWMVHGESPGPSSLLGGLIILATVTTRTVWESRRRPISA
jgi:drug/metabolite transporter (DMT)-like permease